MTLMANTLTRVALAVLMVSLMAPSAAEAAKYKGWFYGNWGGPWYGSGTPVDLLDEACMEHDLAYQTANLTFRKRFQDAHPLHKPAIRVQWIAAYIRANDQLRARARQLPFLRINPDGTDTWGGGTNRYARQRIPASVMYRDGYRVAIEGIMYMPPF